MTARRKRMVILTIPTIAALLKDYVGNGVPDDAVGVGLEINPQENGRLAVVLDVPSLTQDPKDIYVHFDLKRVYSF